jgi:hypothetical protein
LGFARTYSLSPRNVAVFRSRQLRSDRCHSERQVARALPHRVEMRRFHHGHSSVARSSFCIRACLFVADRHRGSSCAESKSRIETSHGRRFRGHSRTLAQPTGSPPWLTNGRLSRAGRWPSHRRPQAGLRLAYRARSKAPRGCWQSRPDLPLGTARPKLCEWTAPTSVIRVVERSRLRIRSSVTVLAILCS